MATIKTTPFEGKDYKEFTVNTDFGKYSVICVPRQYGNGTLAIEMIEVENNTPVDSFAVLTVNLGDPFSQSDEKAFLDTNNNPWAEKFVTDNEIATDEHRYGRSGFCAYPLYSFDLSTLTA